MRKTKIKSQSTTSKISGKARGMIRFCIFFQRMQQFYEIEKGEKTVMSSICRKTNLEMQKRVEMRLSPKAKRQARKQREVMQSKKPMAGAEDESNGILYASSKKNGQIKSPILCLHRKNEKSEDMVNRLISYCRSYGRVSWFDLCATSQ